MKRALVAGIAAIVAVAVASPARAADPDPREQFAQKQYATAAAGFEKRWNATADPVDGVNGVVAWRVSARYAHARALLERIRHSKGITLSPDLASRSDALSEKLARLTATIELHGDEVGPDLVVKVDGVPAERGGDQIIADVGHTDIFVEKEGCPAFRWTGELYPAETKRLVVAFNCPTSPGNLHVGLKTIPDATLAIDGSTIPLHYDVDVRLPPGLHHVLVERNDYALLNELVPIAPRETATRELPVPILAQNSPILLGVTTGAYAGTSGGTGVVGGTFGFEQARALMARISLGGAYSTVGIGTTALYFGATLGVPFLRPIVARAHAGSLWMIDFQPAELHMGVTTRGDFSQENEQLFYGGLAPFRFAWATADVLAELTIWPLGASYHSYQSAYQAPTSTDFGYAATAMFTVSYGFLGH